MASAALTTIGALALPGTAHATDDYNTIFVHWPFGKEIVVAHYHFSGNTETAINVTATEYANHATYGHSVKITVDGSIPLVIQESCTDINNQPDTCCDQVASNEAFCYIDDWTWFLSVSGSSLSTDSATINTPSLEVYTSAIP